MGLISRKGAAGVRNLISRMIRSEFMGGFGSSRMIATATASSSDGSAFFPSSGLRPRLDFSMHLSSISAPSRWNLLESRMMNASVSDDCRSRISPWLMLPPAFEGEGGNMVYKFYSLAENKVVSVDKRGEEEAELENMPEDDAVLVGSSHGWLALFNPRNRDLILSNPLSRRHVKLPPIHTLPAVPGNKSLNNVSKVVISCSPLEENCRAIITYGPTDRLAFCWPGHSTEWTPIGAHFYDEDYDDGRRRPRSYQSFVYSSRHELFFCVTNYSQFEAWDLGDPESPRMIDGDDIVSSVDKENFPVAARSDDEYVLKSFCSNWRDLVVSDKSGELFFVKRYVVDQIGPDGCSYAEDVDAPGGGYNLSIPYKTVGFDVHKHNWEDRSLEYMDSSLDGLSMFIGWNHSFAMSAADFPELKPDSIYYTDLESNIPVDPNSTFGGHDIGIFDYKNRSLSPCYYPCDVQSIKRIVPAPMWFTPSPL